MTEGTTFKKHSGAQKASLLPRAKQLFLAGMDTGEIQNALHSAGFTAPDGGEIGNNHIHSILRMLRQRGEIGDSKPGRTRQAHATGNNPMLAILTDPSLTDSKKVRMLIAYLQD